MHFFVGRCSLTESATMLQQASSASSCTLCCNPTGFAESAKNRENGHELDSQNCSSIPESTTSIHTRVWLHFCCVTSTKINVLCKDSEDGRGGCCSSARPCSLEMYFLCGYLSLSCTARHVYLVWACCVLPGYYTACHVLPGSCTAHPVYLVWACHVLPGYCSSAQ